MPTSKYTISILLHEIKQVIVIVKKEKKSKNKYTYVAIRSIAQFKVTIRTLSSF